MTRVLTEQEVGACAPGTICDSETDGSRYHSKWNDLGPEHPLLRGLIEFANAILAKYGSGSPEEKREAERAAWDAAIDCVLLRDDCTRAVAERARDRQFPRLTPEPPTVTLSDGFLWRRRGGKWEWSRPTSQASWCERIASGMPDCETAEDFEKCRDLMRAEEQAK